VVFEGLSVLCVAANFTDVSSDDCVQNASLTFFKVILIVEVICYQSAVH